MKTEAQLIYDRIHCVQQLLEQKFEQTGKDELEPFYKHRFIGELLEDLKGDIEDIDNGKKLSNHMGDFIDSQFWE